MWQRFIGNVVRIWFVLCYSMEHCTFFIFSSYGAY